MRVFALIGLVGIVGGRVAAWLVKRRRPGLGDRLRLSTIIFTYAVVAVILGATSIAAAQEESRLALAFAVGCGLLAVASVTLAVFYAWAWRVYGADGEED
jgi:hypothetical protein